MNISKGAIEAAAEALALCDAGNGGEGYASDWMLEARVALTAALPHLASQPRRSDDDDEDRMREALSVYVGSTISPAKVAAAVSLLAVVRAEEREAKVEAFEAEQESRLNELAAKDAQISALRECAELARHVDELVFYDPKDDWRSHGGKPDFEIRVEQKKNEIYQRGDMLTIYISEGDWVLMRANAHFARAALQTSGGW